MHIAPSRGGWGWTIPSNTKEIFILGLIFSSEIDRKMDGIDFDSSQTQENNQPLF